MFNRTSDRQALAQFFRQMAVLSSSGVTLHRAIETCGRQTSSRVLRNQSLRLSEDMRHGVRLSAAFGRVGAPFTPLHSGVMLASESTGSYVSAFEQLAVWEENGDRVERRIRSLLAYPVLVSTIATVGTFVLLLFLAPLVKSVTEQVGGQPGLPSRIVLLFGEAAANPKVMGITLFLLAMLAWIGRRASRSPGALTWWEQWSLCLPLVGNLLWKAWLVRVSRCLHSLLDSGLPVVRSIELAAEATGNGFLGQHVLREAAYGVLKGETLSQALPPALMSRAFMGMLSVGETSGAVPDMLRRVADLHEIELNAEIDSLFRATEPILMGVVGLMVLACLLCAFQPLYTLMERM